MNILNFRRYLTVVPHQTSAILLTSVPSRHSTSPSNVCHPPQQCAISTQYSPINRLPSSSAVCHLDTVLPHQTSAILLTSVPSRHSTPPSSVCHPPQQCANLTQGYLFILQQSI